MEGRRFPYRSGTAAPIHYRVRWVSEWISIEDRQHKHMYIFCRLLYIRLLCEYLYYGPSLYCGKFCSTVSFMRRYCAYSVYDLYDMLCYCMICYAIWYDAMDSLLNVWVEVSHTRMRLKIYGTWGKISVVDPENDQQNKKMDDDNQLSRSFVGTATFVLLVRKLLLF